MRHAPRIAAFACAGLALGSLTALAIPTQVKTARNSGLERLSQPQVVAYPGQDRVVGGPDSYPVTYSPQWLAVAEKAERARLAKWALPEIRPPGYDQPPLERDLAVEREGAVEVDVQRGSTDDGEQPEGDEFADADQPDG